jgi:ketosteroid isomerase-like protein
MEAVDEVRRQHMAAVNGGNTDAAVGVFAEGGVFLPPNAPALEGPAAMRPWFDQVFALFDIRDFRIDAARMDQVGDVVIEHGEWSAKFTPKGAEQAIEARGPYLTVYARQADGSVLTIRDMFHGLPA